MRRFAGRCRGPVATRGGVESPNEKAATTTRNKNTTKERLLKRARACRRVLVAGDSTKYRMDARLWRERGERSGVHTCDRGVARY